MIEASDPKGWWLRPLYILHLKALLPLVERLLLRGAQDFAMIGNYCTNFGDAAEFGDMLRAQGLQAEVRRYFFGCATGVSGRKVDASDVPAPKLCDLVARPTPRGRGVLSKRMARTGPATEPGVFAASKPIGPAARRNDASPSTPKSLMPATSRRWPAGTPRLP